MSERLGIPVHASPSPGEAVRGADIVCPATTATQPVVSGADLAPATHINAIGANHAHKRELDDEAIASADVIVVDSVEQSRQEAGDLIIAFHGDETCWTGVKKLSEVVAGKTTGRTSDAEVTRSEEHTSELQSQSNLVCRLLLEKKKTTKSRIYRASSKPNSA